MLVARAQLTLIQNLLTEFGQNDGMMHPDFHYQSQFIAIITLLRSVGHVFVNVDCNDNPDRQAWNKKNWQEWKQEEIFSKIQGKRIKWLILPLHESETDRHLIGLSG